MGFELVLELPGPVDGVSPAMLRVCRQPVVLRLVLGAHRGGATAIAVRGAGVDEARALLQADPRTAELGVVYDEDTPGEAPLVLADANVALATEVWKLLDAAEGHVEVPDAPRIVKLPPGEREAPAAAATPLWQGAPPDRSWVHAVRSRRDARRAKKIIFDNITKTTSGPISRYFNSRFSIPLSKVLVETPMTPNQMTFVNTLLGVIGAVFAAIGSLGALAIAGALLQLTSALDRNDGELARSKMMESEKGAWMDTVGDNITYIAYVLGLTIGYARFAEAEGVAWAPYALPVGLALLVATTLLIGWLFNYVHKQKLGGTITGVSHHFRANVDEKQKGFMFTVLDKVKVLGERDQFSLILGVIAALPWILDAPAIFHGLAATMVGFVVLANVYFALGAVKAGRNAQQASA